MKGIGITGCVGMGKSTAAELLSRTFPMPRFDADVSAHSALESQRIQTELARMFPDLVTNGRVDRKDLSAYVVGKPAALSELESLLHPYIYKDFQEFIAKMTRIRVAFFVADVPLLLETGWDRLCDGVFVVTAPRFLQERRVFARPGMTQRKFRIYEARQFSDKEKKNRADAVIQTGLGRRNTLEEMKTAIRRLFPDA